MAKRKADSVTDSASTGSSKRLKSTSRGTSQPNDDQRTQPAAPPVAGPSAPMPAAAKRGDEGSSKSKKQKQKGVPSIPPSDKKDKHRVRKLVPPRPFPTVPASVSATGPRSAHTEGKNYICITRRTELGAYLRRCKDVFLKDGHKTLHLSAMGAAIPHLMQLALSLPEILPYPRDEVHTEVLTGTVELQDELIPVDDDEDMSYRTRSKSTVSVVIKIGDGVDEPVAGAARGSGRKKNTGRGKSAPSGGGRQKGNKQAISTEPIIFREDEMDES